MAFWYQCDICRQHLGLRRALQNRLRFGAGRPFRYVTSTGQVVEREVQQLCKGCERTSSVKLYPNHNPDDPGQAPG